MSLEWGTLLAAIALLGGVVRWTSPMLSQFPGALIPWPAHGMAMAILLAAPAARRVQVVVLIGLSTVVGAGLNALAADTSLSLAVPPTLLLSAQTLFVVLVYDRVSKNVSPLSGTVPYASMLGVVVLGTIPMMSIAALVLRFTGNAASPNFSAAAWWVAASTSGAAIVGSALTLLPGSLRDEGAKPLLSTEFLAVFALYLVFATAAFAEIGPLTGVITPALAALPFLVWSGMRFGVRGYGVIAALLTLFVIATTWNDTGPFARFDEEKVERFRRGWIYLASLIGPAMIFPVALAERSEAERRARAALAQLSAIIEGTTDLIAAVDLNLRLVAANAGWIRTVARFGSRAFRPQIPVEELYADDPAEREASLSLWRRALAGERFTVLRALEATALPREEFEVTYSPVLDERGDIVGASQIVRNVTERRQREAQDIESRRLESVGRLAGGVAHDFNNLMTAVMGYSELVSASLPPDDERRADLAEVERAAARAGELTPQPLAFARQRNATPAIVDASALVHGLTRMIAPLVGPNVTLQVNTASRLHSVRVDPVQFEQVIMNLAVNASHAMPGGGLLRIETADAMLDGIPGVMLTVQDSGAGMTPEVQERMFEPFFTTKPLGEGTGLGLATVHGIVYQSGGRIEVISKPGEGATFNIFFPAASHTDDSPPSPRPAPR